MSAQAVIFFLAIALARGQSNNKDNELQYCRFEDDFGSTTMICENIMNEKQLDDDIIKSAGSNAVELIIANSTFRYLFHDVFYGMQLKGITIENCTLQSLTETDVAFKGLEDQLTNLEVMHTNFVTGWNWNHLRNLRALTRVSVAESEMTDLTEDMMGLPSGINRLSFIKNGVSWIHPNVFSHLHKLQRLIIAHNEITEVKRSMLPNPASELVYLRFSNNRISHLPQDIFENMPQLTVIDLNDNQFFTIDEGTFSPIMDQLKFFHFMHNPVNCDCRVEWLTRKWKNPRTHVLAYCFIPSSLEGKNIVQLKAKDLWC